MRYTWWSFSFWADFFLLLHYPPELLLRGWHWSVSTCPYNTALFQCSHCKREFIGESSLWDIYPRSFGSSFNRNILDWLWYVLFWFQKLHQHSSFSSFPLIITQPTTQHLGFLLGSMLFLSRTSVEVSVGHFISKIKSSFSGHNQTSMKQICGQGFLRTVCSGSL